MTNKLKPFDLQAALKGEPVMVRDGRKAFVRHYETDQAVASNSRVWGIVLRDGAVSVAVRWTKQGRILGSVVDNKLDIVGMYPKTRIINGFEVPSPETKEPSVGSVYYIPMFTNEDLCENVVWDVHSAFDIRLLELGLVFLTKEDAIANAKAMVGINPYED